MKAFASLHIQHQKTDVFHCLPEPGSLGHWHFEKQPSNKYSTVPAPMQLMWSNLSNGPRTRKLRIRKVDSFHKCLSYVLNSRSLLTGLDENYMFCSIVVWWPLATCAGGFHELRCRQSSAKEERLVRLQTVLKPVSLGGMVDFIGEPWDSNLKVILWLSYLYLLVVSVLMMIKILQKNMT